MARRGLTGQLNMFDLFQSLEDGAPGEVEMVSLVPEYEEEPEEEEVPTVIEISEVEDIPKEEEIQEMEELPKMEEPQVAEVVPVAEKVAMSRSYVIDGEKIEIAYINYNKVRITKGMDAPLIKEFASSKDAVDYYVEQMQEYEEDE